MPNTRTKLAKHQSCAAFWQEILRYSHLKAIETIVDDVSLRRGPLVRVPECTPRGPREWQIWQSQQRLKRLYIPDTICWCDFNYRGICTSLIYASTSFVADIADHSRGPSSRDYPRFDNKGAKYLLSFLEGRYFKKVGDIFLSVKSIAHCNTH